MLSLDLSDLLNCLMTLRLYPKERNKATYKYVLDKTHKCLLPIALDLPI